MKVLPLAHAPPDRVPHRLLITLCTVGATLMQALDQTIANVALPYMQGSLSATYDEITWVLTSSKPQKSTQADLSASEMSMERR